jgi:LysM repeat protein
LIEAVNQLRMSRGLDPLTVNSILMQTAQMQADALLISEGAVGHTRPNGLSYTDQLILLGYPLAGDLSLGGYRGENFIAAHPDVAVAAVIQMWLGDSLHANTMLSPYYMDIGAGVAVAQNGTKYLVIDCARRTASGTPQAYTPVSSTSGANDHDSGAVIQYIQPVILATARPDGDVIHEVAYGHALWSIAIAYGVKIEQIQRYNNLSDTTIYTGQRLLVQKGATQPAPTQDPTSTGLPGISRTTTPTLISSPTPNPNEHINGKGGEIPSTDQDGTLTAIQGVSQDQVMDSSMTLFIAGIFLVSMLVGALITWLETRRKR